VQAWAQHAGNDAALAIPLQEGFGLASMALATAAGQKTIEAFGLLHPPERLALLYCRGRASRQGRAGAILGALEQHARQRGILRLRTEASQLSRPLLERRGWRVDAEETVLFAGAWFERWRMIKVLSADGGRSRCDERG
jgi:GNAT superfamily N-acetyltransferase